MAFEPILTISILRIFACYMIFSHHYLKTINVIYDITPLGMFAVGIFSFISGYLSFYNKKIGVQWLTNQIIKIYIPFLLTIIPLLSFCYLTDYKKVAFENVIFESFAGGLFLHKPVLEQGWYVTFVIGLYFITYITENNIFFNKTLTCLIVSAFYYYVLTFTVGLSYITNQRLAIWISCYVLGYLISNVKHGTLFSYFKSFSVSRLSPDVNRFFYSLSVYAFTFYLVHPVPLNLLYGILHFNAESTLVIGLVISLILAYLLQVVSQQIILRIKSTRSRFTL